MTKMPASTTSTITLAPTGTARRGKAIALAVVAYCLIVGLVFYDTVASIVMIWARSETFAHGFIILPISLWLLWRQRAQLVEAISYPQQPHPQAVRPQPWALFLVLAGGAVWLLAYMVDVQVVQQLAFVGILISGVWVIAGTRLAWCAAFPLGFLFLAVPMGEDLIPPLMELTADTTEFLVRASGIPVYRQGMYLSLPTGHWSVVEECSGVRYLIASLTLGLIYAYLTYYSIWRRVAFVLVAIVTPIVANSLRAYGIVMLGHLSDMKLAAGVDHLIYGWVFFGLVMLLLFWLGGFFQEDAPPKSSPKIQIPDTAHQATGNPVGSLTLCTVLAIICVVAWPVLALAMNRTMVTDFPPLAAPLPMEEWQIGDGQDLNWQPAHQGADRALDQIYTASQPVGLYLRQHLQQHDGVELVTTAETLRPDRNVWWIVQRQTSVIELDVPVKVNEAMLASGHQRLLIWSWYRVAGRYTSNPYTAKLLEAKQQIVEGRRYGTRLFIATPTGENPAVAREVLQAFIAAHRTAIDEALDTGIDTE